MNVPSNFSHWELGLYLERGAGEEGKWIGKELHSMAGMLKDFIFNPFYQVQQFKYSREKHYLNSCPVLHDGAGWISTFTEP